MARSFSMQINAFIGRRGRAGTVVVLLSVIAFLMTCVAIAAAWRLVGEISQGPRGSALLLGYSVLGFAGSGAALSLAIDQAARNGRLSISRRTWIIGSTGILASVVLI